MIVFDTSFDRDMQRSTIIMLLISACIGTCTELAEVYLCYKSMKTQPTEIKDVSGCLRFLASHVDEQNSVRASTKLRWNIHSTIHVIRIIGEDFLSLIATLSWMQRFGSTTLMQVNSLISAVSVVKGVSIMVWQFRTYSKSMKKQSIFLRCSRFLILVLGLFPIIIGIHLTKTSKDPVFMFQGTASLILTADEIGRDRVYLHHEWTFDGNYEPVHYHDWNNSRIYFQFNFFNLGSGIYAIYYTDLVEKDFLPPDQICVSQNSSECVPFTWDVYTWERASTQYDLVYYVFLEEYDEWYAMDCDPIQSTCSAYLFAYLLKSLLGSEDQLDPGGGATDKVWNSQGQVLNCYESNYSSSDCIYDIDVQESTYYQNASTSIGNQSESTSRGILNLDMQIEITHGVIGCY